MDNSSMSPADISALMGGNNGGSGSWSWLIIVLFIFAFAGGGMWGGNSQGATTADIQRAVDLNSIQTGQANIAADIQRTTYETMGTVKDASYNNLSEVRDLQAAISSGFANQSTCCCEVKSNILENRYLDAQNTSAIQLAMAQQKADLATAIHAEGEETRNLLQQNKIEALQNQINQLQLNSAMCGVVRYPTSTTYSAVNPYGVYGTTLA